MGDTKGSPSAGECGGKPQRGYDRWMGDRARGVREAKNKISVNVWNTFSWEPVLIEKHDLLKKWIYTPASSQISLATKSRMGFCRPNQFGEQKVWQVLADQNDVATQIGMSRNPITISGAKRQFVIDFVWPSKASTISGWPVCPKGEAVSRNPSQSGL